MSKLSLFVPSLLLPILLMTACGGGGSKTPVKPSETPSSSSVSSVSLSSLPTSVSSLSTTSLSTSSLPLSSLSSSAVSSSVDSSSSSLSQASSSLSFSSMAAQKVAGTVEFVSVDGPEVGLVDATTVTVTLLLLDENDKPTNSKTASLINSVGNKTSALPFNIELAGATGKFLVVQISRLGYTDYARRFEVAAELNIKATLSKVPADIISASTAVTISGAAVDGFNFSVSDAGNPEAAGVSDGIADLTVSIPKSALPAGTASIDVKMQAFNPNYAEDAERFPGAYADSDGNKLLSVAFNYTDITTDTGVSLQKMAAAAKSGNQSLLKKMGWNKAEAEPVVINRKIPQESCSALRQMGDSSAQLPGFQVPVYTYNPEIGLWDLLGQGTLYSDAGKVIAENFKDFDCAANDYVLEIKVSNEIFISNWWNLDYPLVFSQPTKLCADIQLVDDDSKPIANEMVFVHDNDDERSFSAENFVTDGKGIVHIETYSLDPVVTDTDVELLLYSKSFTSVAKSTINLSQSCAPTTPVVIKTHSPAVCKVEGVVKDTAGNLLKNSVLYADAVGEKSESFMFGVGWADDEGKYSMEVSCGQKYQLEDYFELFSNILNPNYTSIGYEFSIDRNVTANEFSDDGKTAILKELVFDRSKPTGNVFTDDDDRRQLNLNFMYAGSAYPLTYSFDAVDISSDKVFAHYSGTATQADIVSGPEDNAFSLSSGLVRFPNTIAWPVGYSILRVKGELKDAAGNKSELWGSIYNPDTAKK